jgi:outer membrane murein-binding lipoprotein Lpp
MSFRTGSRGSSHGKSGDGYVLDEPVEQGAGSSLQDARGGYTTLKPHFLALTLPMKNTRRLMILTVLASLSASGCATGHGNSSSQAMSAQIAELSASISALAKEKTARAKQTQTTPPKDVESAGDSSNHTGGVPR